MMSRRGVAISAAVCAGLLGALTSASAEMPAPSAVTPELVAAAVREGRVDWYTANELSVAEAVARAFEAKYPGITVAVERSGAERNFQRIGQEYAANIHSVDVVDDGDTTHFQLWKDQGWLAPFLPAGAQRLPAEYKDADGAYLFWRATLTVMAYNTRLLKPEEAPKSFAELLLPKWQGKLVQAHPAYSGTTLTAMDALVRTLGWPYFQALGKQRVMQVQSASDTPKKVSSGERPVMVDGVEYTVLGEKSRGAPIAVIYPLEGAPFIPASCAVMKEAPHPNAARLLESFFFAAEAQKVIIDIGFERSIFPDAAEPADRTSLKDIKIIDNDSRSTAEHAEEIKKLYSAYFGI